MKIKLLMLALSLSATGIATAMVGSDANRPAATDAIAMVLTPDGYAHSMSFTHLAQTDASLGMPALQPTQVSLSWTDPGSGSGSAMDWNRFLLQPHPHDAASSRAAFHGTAVTSTNTIAQIGFYDAAYQLSPHVQAPQTWAMLLAGLGLIALQLRRANRARMIIN